MFQEAVSLSFIFLTVAVILVCTVIAVIYIKTKAKKVDKNDAI